VKEFINEHPSPAQIPAVANNATPKRVKKAQDKDRVAKDVTKRNIKLIKKREVTIRKPCE